MPKISQYPLVTLPDDTDVFLVVQGGVTKIVAFSLLKASIAGTGTADTLPECFAENDFVIAEGSPISWTRQAFAQVKSILGIGASVPAPAASNDVIMAGGSPLDWVTKTIAQLKSALGLGSAAYTETGAYDAAGVAAGLVAGKADKVATSPDPTGYVAEFDVTGNIVKSSKLSSIIHAAGSDNQSLAGLASKAPTSPAPTGYVAEYDATGDIVKSSKLASDIHALGADDQNLSGLATKVATSPAPTGLVATFDSSGNLATSVIEVEDIVISEDVAAIVQITQAAYDLLSPPVSTTLYIIIG